MLFTCIFFSSVFDGVWSINVWKLFFHLRIIDDSSSGSFQSTSILYRNIAQLETCWHITFLQGSDIVTTRNVGYPESGVKHICFTPEIRIASAPIWMWIAYLGIYLGIILLGGKDYTFPYRDKRGYPDQIIWASLSLHKQRLYGSWKANFVGGELSYSAFGDCNWL